ncbi:hypothetical protein BJ165DRAFT_1545512 [Panaeolus papilionaceus]|nr:hypothetical protein BJ165DRAFT_1545512 [Panaeolus papilionaceus]
MVFLMTKNGAFLPPDALPQPASILSSNDFSPFQDHAQFCLANLLYQKLQVSGTTMDKLTDIWAETLDENTNPPFLNKQHLYNKAWRRTLAILHNSLQWRTRSW